MSRFDYVLQQADNCLILGQRLAEWCGHGPVLEQDIALTNISLDLIGQSRMLYQYAAKLQNEGKSEDELAFLRDAWDFKNVQLVEQPNGDFGQTVLRQFLVDTFNCFYYEALKSSNDQALQAIAQKSHKESLYHVKWSGEWIIRLGDGTEESHERMQHAIDNLWPYKDEIVQASAADNEALKQGYGVDLAKISQQREEKIAQVMQEATLSIPEDIFPQGGGKDGIHTELLGYILAEMQFLQRAYPGNEW